MEMLKWTVIRWLHRRACNAAYARHLARLRVGVPGHDTWSTYERDLCNADRRYRIGSEPWSCRLRRSADRRMFRN